MIRHKESRAVQPDQPAYQMKKWKNGITSIIIVRSGWNFAWSFLKRLLVMGIKKSLGNKIFLQQPKQPKTVLLEIFWKNQKMFKYFRNMIAHDCWNVINKNFTVILIYSLYLANFHSNKILKNAFLGLICMKNELT